MMKRVREAGHRTSAKGYVLIALVIAVVVLPHLWNAWCRLGWSWPAP